MASRCPSCYRGLIDSCNLSLMYSVVIGERRVEEEEEEEEEEERCTRGVAVGIRGGVNLKHRLRNIDHPPRSRLSRFDAHRPANNAFSHRWLRK